MQYEGFLLIFSVLHVYTDTDIKQYSGMRILFPITTLIGICCINTDIPNSRESKQQCVLRGQFEIMKSLVKMLQKRRYNGKIPSNCIRHIAYSIVHELNDAQWPNKINKTIAILIYRHLFHNLKVKTSNFELFRIKYLHHVVYTH